MFLFVQSDLEEGDEVDFRVRLQDSFPVKSEKSNLQTITM